MSLSRKNTAAWLVFALALCVRWLFWFFRQSWYYGWRSASSDNQYGDDQKAK